MLGGLTELLCTEKFRREALAAAGHRHAGSQVFFKPSHISSGQNSVQDWVLR